MKQQLWIINSSFIAFFIISLIITNVLKIEPPQLYVRKKVHEQPQKKKEIPTKQTNWENIFKNDIFKTFTPKIKKPIKKSFVTPIPEPKQPSVTTPPEQPKQNFVDPLKINIKGIIVANDEARNITMIEDESKKESVYHLGEKIKDAQIIKITKNRVVILRGNGQQEVFFLRKDDVKAESNEPNKWKYIVKKVGDLYFEIDPDHFKTEVLSLGNFLERSAIIGTAYHKGKPIGIRVGTPEKNDVGMMLGLQQNDIIISVENITTGQMKNRIKIYDYIKKLKIGNSFNITIQRNNKIEKLTYKLIKISKEKRKIFTGSSKKEENKKENFKMSRIQEREKLLRSFRQHHPRTRQHKEAIARIRQRLLENLKNRLKNARIR